MNIDTQFPPPPQHNQPPLPCDDITPPRQRALDRLSVIASIAEAQIGILSLDGVPGYKVTARGFATHCFESSPFGSEIAELLSRAKLSITASDHVDAEHVMLINPRKYWGILGPLRGDIVIFADGHAAIVTKPLCRGCQHFEAVSLVSTDGPPQIVKATHWTSTVLWIVRLIDEREADAEPVVSAPAAPFLVPAPAAEAAPEPAPVEPPPAKKRKVSGIG